MAEKAYLVECLCLNLICATIWTVLCEHHITDNCEWKLDSIHCNGAFPDKIPNGVSKVDCTLPDDKHIINITTDLFIDETWIHVEELSIFIYSDTTIQAKAFQRLVNLTTLGLHAARSIDFETGSFEGVQSLRVFNLSSSRYVTMDTVTEIINGTGIMPQFESIILSGIDSTGHKALDISRNFLAAIATTNVATIDFSESLISELPIDDFIDILCDRHLEIKCSRCFFSRIQFTHRQCSDFHLFDLRFPTNQMFFQPIIPHDILIPVFENSLRWVDFFTHIDTVLLDQFFAAAMPYYFRNISLYYIGKDTLANKNVSLASNKFIYLDVKCLNCFQRIEILDLSSNGMEYIQPQLLPEQNELRQLVLSNNNLNMMATNNETEFQHLTSNYKHLQNINLSNNNLSFIPVELFRNNLDLQLIDLSKNIFEQIDFNLRGNKYLQHLSMSDNKISLLSRHSIDNIRIAIKRNKSFTVDLRNNDLLCDGCKCKDFIEWIITENNVIFTDGICYNGKTKVQIDKKILSNIISMCQLKRRIILACSLSVCLILITIYVAKAIKKFMTISVRKYKLKQIREDKHKFRFVTFLAFSGNDEDFVENNLKLLLEKQLRETVGTDRELICTGDRHFKLGRTLPDQMDISCQTRGSVIFVVSESFCRSPHCNNELHIAYVNQKPIILMFKEYVDESNMSPLLKVVFKQFTRLTWKVKGEKYTISASWKHICDSLIDNMGES